jgi:hypothetical protein
LAHAEEAIDRRLQIAKQRKAEVGFVKEVLAASGCALLDSKLDADGSIAAGPQGRVDCSEHDAIA